MIKGALYNNKFDEETREILIDILFENTRILRNIKKQLED